LLLKNTNLFQSDWDLADLLTLKKGKICSSHHIDGWNNFPVGAWLRKISGLPVQVENDAQYGSSGRSIKRCGKNIETCFLCYTGQRNGWRDDLNGKIYHGEKPGESEIGMMLFDHKLNTMESQCSGWSC